MGNLEKFQQPSTVNLIYEYHKKRGDSEPVRGYLGASIIGHPCERYLWYLFRQATLPNFSGRMYRLFETGDLAEARFTAELRAIGCEVHDCDSGGEQFEITDFGGHFAGHMDGCVLGLPEAPKTWHVSEYKTLNNKSFKKLLKEKVQKSKPMHYAQMQAYMHKTGMKRALYLAVNKDTDELYMERVYYDKEFCLRLFGMALRVISSPDPPPRISERQDYYQCGWCDANAICHGTESPDPALPLPSLSCRQCCHATPLIDGQDGRPGFCNRAAWWCEKQEWTIEDTDKPCKEHLILPGLISFAEPTDYGVNEEENHWIEFTNLKQPNNFLVNEEKWIHGAGGFSSKELRIIPANLLTEEKIHEAKEVFNVIVKSVEQDLLLEYPDPPVWTGPSCDLFSEWKKRYREELKDLTPTRQCEMFDYGCLEYDDGDRLVIAYKDSHAEIREGVPF